jgi:YegS/Rv2252/BmrU family lipid kinase
VIAVGGDGTLHEVAHELMRARDAGVKLPRLGVVGQGTGGDFRRTLGLEHRLDRYCQVIASGKTRAVDVGRFWYRADDGAETQHYFLNILSVGMGGLVDRYVAGASRALGGTVAYLGASLKALARSEVGVLACKLGRNEERREIEIATRTIAICNGRFFGSGMEVAPMAEPDDGCFEVVSLGGAPKLKFMVSSLAIYGGSHIGKPGVEHHRCDRIEIDLRNEAIRDEFPLDVDGEPLGTLPLRVEVVPKAIEVLVG